MDNSNNKGIIKNLLNWWDRLKGAASLSSDQQEIAVSMWREAYAAEQQARAQASWARRALDFVRARISRRERNLYANEFVVKRKLGQAFFTRKITPAYRSRVLRSLTRGEYALARFKGWVR